MDSYEKYQGIDAGASAEVTIEEDAELCAGGLVAMACKALASIEGAIGASVEGSTSFLDDFSDDSFSHGFTITCELCIYSC